MDYDKILSHLWRFAPFLRDAVAFAIAGGAECVTG